VKYVECQRNANETRNAKWEVKTLESNSKAKTTKRFNEKKKTTDRLLA
jgi:hypothetical protein